MAPWLVTRDHWCVVLLPLCSRTSVAHPPPLPPCSGIWIWSQPFLRRLPGSGKTVAVLLVDTQGTFDNKTTMKENATIFALNALISSFQVYNISKLLGEDKLQVCGLDGGKRVGERCSDAFAIFFLSPSHSTPHRPIQQKQHMHLFTKFGQFVHEQDTDAADSRKPFQTLQVWPATLCICIILLLPLL